MIDRLIINLSNAGMLNLETLRTVLIASGDEEEVRLDIERGGDAEDNKSRDVYRLVLLTTGTPHPRFPPSSLIEGSVEDDAAWDAWRAERDKRFWRVVRRVAGWSTPKMAPQSQKP